MDHAVPLDEIDGFIAEQMKLGNTPGIGLSVIRRGETVLERGYGHADLETGRTMTHNTPVVVGSTTKALTAAAIMQLVEAGRLDLDNPVQKYLPSFRLADDAVAARLTVRQALSHTGGLPPTPSDAPTFVPWFAPASLEEYIEEMSALEPVWEPGAGWLYANDGYALAGRIVEVVSGQAYAEYITQHIFEPLAMLGARFPATPKPDSDVAIPYDYAFDGTPYPSYFPFDPCYAQGLAILSAHDAGRWLRAVLNGGELEGRRVFSNQSLQEMLTPVAGCHPPGGSADRQYGLGWGTGGVEAGRVFSHGGSAITMGSQFIVAPEEDLAVAVVANSGTQVTAIVAQGILRLIRGQKPELSYPRVDPDQQVDSSQWGRLLGTYRATVPQNGITSLMPLEMEGAALVFRTYPGTQEGPAGNTYLVPTGDLSFVLFGRGRTGMSASFEIEGPEVRATVMGVPCIKVAAPVHQGTVLRWT